MPDSNASPPCFAHQLVDGHVVDAQTAHDVAVFRKSERQRLYALRKLVSAAENVAMAEIIAAGLNRAIGEMKERVIAVYWPIRGEIDLRHFMGEAHDKGASIVLPVVIEKQQPLEFHRWSPRAPMKRGIWDIPVPTDSAPMVPDVVIAPLVGVDNACFRLGNGGGYYDRTLARLKPDTLVIGVGHAFCRIDTIFPQVWDIAMKLVLLGDGSRCDAPQ